MENQGLRDDILARAELRQQPDIASWTDG